MNERTVRLNVNMPAGHGAGCPDWMRLFRFMVAGQTPLLQEDTTKASYSHYLLGPPSPTPPDGREVWCLQATGFYDGCFLPGSTDRQVQPTDFASPKHFLPPGIQCVLIIPWITELYRPAPPQLEPLCVCMCVCACTHTHTRTHVYLFDSFNWGQGIG